MSGIVEVMIAAVGSGAIGAVTGHLTARRRASASEAIAARIHDERVAPALMERMRHLESRLDERDTTIDTLQTQASECEAGRIDCKRRVAELSVQLAKLRSEQDHIRHTIRSTPPGEWRLDADVMRGE